MASGIRAFGLAALRRTNADSDSEPDSFAILPDGRKRGHFPRFDGESKPVTLTLTAPEFHAIPFAKSRRERIETHLKARRGECHFNVRLNRYGAPRTDTRVQVSGMSEFLVDKLPALKSKQSDDKHRSRFRRRLYPSSEGVPTTVKDAVVDALRHPRNHLARSRSVPPRDAAAEASAPPLPRRLAPLCEERPVARAASSLS